MRKVILRGILKEPVLELHPPSLQVMQMIPSEARTLADASITKVSLSAMDKLETMYGKFVSALELNAPAKYRVWKVDGLDLDGIKYPSGKLLAEGGVLMPLPSDNAQMSKTLEEAIVQSEESFVVEVAVGEKWIVDAASVKVNPDIYTGTTPTDPDTTSKEAGPLFKPGSGFFSKMQSSMTGTNKADADSSTKNQGIIDGLFDVAVSKGLFFPLGASSKFSGTGKTKAEKEKGPTMQPGLLGLSNMCVHVLCRIHHILTKYLQGKHLLHEFCASMFGTYRVPRRIFPEYVTSITAICHAKVSSYSWRLPGRVESR